MILKPTGGEWKPRFCKDGYGVFSGDVMVARIDNTVGEFNQEKVNAHLIAAAPAMLVLFQKIKDFLDDGNRIEDGSQAYVEIEEVIEKTEVK